MHPQTQKWNWRLTCADQDDAAYLLVDDFDGGDACLFRIAVEEGAGALSMRPIPDSV